MSNELDVLKIGGVVDGFEITEMLGKGAFGVVMEAVSDTDESCALKFSRSDCPAFTNEVETLTALKGTGLAPELLHVGQFQGLNYFRMAECVGSVLDLVHMTMRGELTSTVIQKILFQTNNALQSIHGLGYLHQDVKTENIFLSAPDHRNTVRVVLGDWGLAARHRNGKRVEGDIRPGGNTWYASATAKMGHEYTVLDDILMLSYCAWSFQSLDVDEFSGEDSVAYKIKLLKEPNETLPDSLQWLLPFFASIQEAIMDDGSMDYAVISEGIEDVLRDSNGSDDIVLVGGETVIE